MMNMQDTFYDGNERVLYNISSKCAVGKNGGCTITDKRVYFTGQQYYLDGKDWIKAGENNFAEIKDVGIANRIKWSSAKAWQSVLMLILFAAVAYIFFSAFKAQANGDTMMEKSELSVENVVEHFQEQKSAVEYEFEAEEYYETAKKYAIVGLIMAGVLLVVGFAIVISTKKLNLLKISVGAYAYAIPVSGINRREIEDFNRALMQAKDMYMRQYVYPQMNMVHDQQAYQQTNPQINM